MAVVVDNEPAVEIDRPPTTPGAGPPRRTEGWRDLSWACPGPSPCWRWCSLPSALPAQREQDAVSGSAGSGDRGRDRCDWRGDGYRHRRGDRDARSWCAWWSSSGVLPRRTARRPIATTALGLPASSRARVRRVSRGPAGCLKHFLSRPNARIIDVLQSPGRGFGSRRRLSSAGAIRLIGVWRGALLTGRRWRSRSRSV
jgi:hypothetical protein